MHSLDPCIKSETKELFLHAQVIDINIYVNGLGSLVYPFQDRFSCNPSLLAFTLCVCVYLGVYVCLMRTNYLWSVLVMKCSRP